MIRVRPELGNPIQLPPISPAYSSPSISDGTHAVINGIHATSIHKTVYVCYLHDAIIIVGFYCRTWSVCAWLLAPCCFSAWYVVHSMTILLVYMCKCQYSINVDSVLAPIIICTCKMYKIMFIIIIVWMPIILYTMSCIYKIVWLIIIIIDYTVLLDECKHSLGRSYILYYNYSNKKNFYKNQEEVGMTKL